MSELPYRPLPYRLCAGFMLVNADGLVFVGERINKSAHGFWQMPQGGIDPGEDPMTAALRELEEETGVRADQVEIIAGGDRTFKYDLPPELLGRVWKGKYRGQEQYWYLGRFSGSDADIDLNAHDPAEFQSFRWVDVQQLPELIIPFKRAVYEELVEEFAPLI
ncbi:RNA pyrophosphohydrolase [Erythrobacter sp. SCSIO 43205]|uniref:RNA pyrophosphohydrolase n=1 Tax=Erythrobacter sp. SCSIO 43205 TaxID=2779361 RepID=UPI001CA7D3BE|nr:RNA pyrophosphohydrolase [Erythrobacter sp. SCSIO 43205]UAB77307.1 RNA pyrophosphohydrolase [Erythrobacter sp. SCSIO 43205]